MIKSFNIEFLFLMLIITTCSKKVDYENKLKFNTILFGKIENFQPHKNDYTIKLIEENIITDKSDVSIAFVDTISGEFDFNYKLEIPKTIILRYQNNNYSVLVKPQDTIIIRIDTDINEDLHNFKVIKSSFPIINSHMNQILSKLYDIQSEYHLPDHELVDSITWSDHNNSIKNRMAKVLNDLCQSSGIENELFMKWGEKTINYITATNAINNVLMKRLLSRKKNKKYDINNPAINLERISPQIDEILAFTDSTELSNNYFYYFYNSFNAYLFSIIIKEKYENEIESDKKNYDQYKLDYINKNFNSFNKNILISRFLYQKIIHLKINKNNNDIKLVEELINDYKDSLPESYSEFLLNELSKVKSLKSENYKIKHNKTHDLSQIKNFDFWRELISSYKGNVLYVKFWAPWCGPCMANWNSIPELIESFSNEDFKAISICINTDKERWEKTIKSLHIPIDHYYLSNDQSNIISDKFQISSIPRNILINKKGDVANLNAPESGGNDGIINKILYDQILILLSE